MATLYADTISLGLHTGAEVRALVRVNSATRQPKCLLVHGNPGSLVDWESIFSRLSLVADVAAIDMPGFGRSPRIGTDPTSSSLDRLADHAVAAADALSWNEPFVLVGHSHGGGVAQTAAVRHPQRIRGLVLIATLGAPMHRSYRLLSTPGAAAVVGLAARMFRSASLRPLASRLLRAVMRDIYFPEQVPASKVDAELTLLAARPEILQSMVHVTLGRPCEQLAASAPDIECPVLFLHGQNDALVPAACARSIHDGLVAAGRRSEFQLLSRSGHMLIEFQAAEAADRIVRFLER
jgi:pimeloyl-ACP methyl ester carboxylesterase